MYVRDDQTTGYALTVADRRPLARTRARRAVRRACAPPAPRGATCARVRAARAARLARRRPARRDGEPLPVAAHARGRGPRPLRMGRLGAWSGEAPLRADPGGTQALP